ncbi:MAG: serine O-acetyltransferase [Campylobacterota bacterium]|nr:serine O-acetyltransferase [Campylobacterota bacterium]
MGLFSEIKEDFANVYKHDPAIRSKFEFIFNYPGVWALFWHRITHRMYLRGFQSLARVIMGFSQLFTSIDLHPGASIGRRVFIDHGVGVVIGETCIIEDDVLIYQGVTLGGVSLDRGIKRHPTIRRGAVIGGGAKILGNIVIGEDAKIGANSVVVRDVPDNSTAVGIPAHVIEKGRDKGQHSHNKLPDINKELFEYLMKRVAVLEHIIRQDNTEVLEKDLELEHIYDSFIKAMKN